MNPLCPNCNDELSCASSNGRDTETMGGCSVDYYHCEKCNLEWEMINKNIYPCGNGHN